MEEHLSSPWSQTTPPTPNKAFCHQPCPAPPQASRPGQGFSGVSVTTDVTTAVAGAAATGRGPPDPDVHRATRHPLTPEGLAAQLAARLTSVLLPPQSAFS